MRFLFIHSHARIFHITTMCRVLKVSRAGYYAWRARPLAARVKEDRRLSARIRVIYEEAKGRYGSPRVYQELRALGLPCGKHRTARLMRVETGLGCPQCWIHIRLLIRWSGFSPCAAAGWRRCRSLRRCEWP